MGSAPGLKGSREERSSLYFLEGTKMNNCTLCNRKLGTVINRMEIGVSLENDETIYIEFSARMVKDVPEDGGRKAIAAQICGSCLSRQALSALKG